MINILKTIWEKLSSLTGKKFYSIISGRNSTNIIGNNNNVNNGQKIEIDKENETIIIKNYGEEE